MGKLQGIGVFKENPSWRHQLLRLLAEVSDGGGDLFEIIETASSMKTDDEDDWYRKWQAVGAKNFSKGLAADEAGHGETAREFFLRASNYYRMSDFYLSPEDPREMSAYDRTVESFQKASRYFAHSFEMVDVPFEGKAMPAYFLSAGGKEPTPTVVLMGGADALKEEYYFRGALECVERGMSCLLVDGPGQGTPLRKHKMYIRYDYEKPLTAIIDYLYTRADVQEGKVGYVASSLGGYFAVRAAAYEKRIAAAVAWSACYDVLKDIYEFFPPIRRRLRQISGSESEAEAGAKLASFTLEGSVGRVSCPLLIVHGEEDYVCDPEAARRVYSEANEPKTLMMYREGELGSLHAQQDNLDETKSFIFDWLHDAFYPRPG